MEYHQQQLEKHCRVCGKRLHKAKSKTTVYPCIHHQDPLMKCFEIDVSRDDPTTHPSKFCNPCYAVTRRWTKAAMDTVHYAHNVKSMEWSSHSENCAVRWYV